MRAGSLVERRHRHSPGGLHTSLYCFLCLSWDRVTHRQKRGRRQKLRNDGRIVMHGFLNIEARSCRPISPPRRKQVSLTHLPGTHQAVLRAAQS